MVRKYIPYGKQNITNDDIDSVIEVLKSPYLTQGPLTKEFQSALVEKTGSKYSTVMNSATSVLHSACLALGLGKNDILWTSPITFVASANCALYCGANVDFVDIDPNNGLISIEKLEEKLKRAKHQNKLPKILIPVHLAGSSCDMKKIANLSNKYGFKVIEDASHAIGGRYENEPIGNCHYSSICVFSFHPVKIITTGEGGAATTNDAKLNNSLIKISSHGITKESKNFIDLNTPDWYYEQQELGFNYRMNDIQAALGISQLKRLESIVKERNRQYNFYRELFKNTKIKLLSIPTTNYSALHLCIIYLDLKNKESYKTIFQELRSNGIGVQLHYYPVHLQPYYKKIGFKFGDFPNSEEFYLKTLSIPLYPGLTDEEQKYVANCIIKTATPFII